jgi:hypothetical protein
LPTVRKIFLSNICHRSVCDILIGIIMRAIWTATAVIVSGVLLASCRSNTSEIKEYLLSLEEAARRLDNADNDGFRYHRHCGVLFDFGSHRNEDNSVTWTARANRRNIFSFSVTVVPSAEGITTKVNVDLDESGREFYDGNQKYNHPLMPQPIRPAIAELIDSALNQRPFDNERVAETGRYLRDDNSPSATACGDDLQVLERGFEADYDAPEGIDVETVRKMAEKFNWPKN